LDLRYSEQDEQFRKELRAWLASEVPAHGPAPEEGDWPARRDYDTGWQRKLFDAGYAGINWPKEYGGRGALPSEQLVYYEEIARARAPYIGVNFVGMLHGGPTVIIEGTDEQKRAHLSKILSGDEVWCQGFSEPNAGSDLASLSTRAVRIDDEYVINGHKTWTSFAQVADYCEMLVRTDVDAPKHKGISWLIVPMDTPGIEIRPLKTLVGTSEFSEVFLEDVRVPASGLVGKENEGWRVANVTLRFERGTSFASQMVELKQYLANIIDVAKRIDCNHGTAWDDVGLRREIGHLQAELDALWAMLKLSISQANESGVPGLGGSALKLVYTELYQRVADLGLDVIGRAGLSREDLGELPVQHFTFSAMQSLSLTIAAGSSQIQRNIIAERILGLPKDR
jgi:alkylation response protein AidB-like acyl-CoA dehydrogenase